MKNFVIEIQAADGTAKANLFFSDVPATMASADSQKAGLGQPGVALYRDVFGLRPALDKMVKRLASEGYTVLVPDLFYRSGPYGSFDAKTAVENEHIRNQLIGLIGVDQVSWTPLKSFSGVSHASFSKRLPAGVSASIGRVGTIRTNA
ncbi:dienelactone hydrolase family protein [Hyphomicrobium sp.]|uniref:dienelactone hydrolase family protein n=1 Tax=Hyphomicrobium sp. TaxID=82 RepID=UPI002FDF563A